MNVRIPEETWGELTAFLRTGYSSNAMRWREDCAGLLTFPEGSLPDFLQALQVLGASYDRPATEQGPPAFLNIHLNCPWQMWTDTFGAPQIVDTHTSPSYRLPLHTWTHACSDGPVTCVGHLVERASGERRVILVRVRLV